MSSLLDRVNQELEAFGKRAQAALDEGKSQIELLRVRRQRDGIARDLGVLYYRRERGTEVDARRVDSLMLQLDDAEAQIAALEHEVAAARGSRGATVHDAPAPPSTVVDAEVITAV